MDNFGGSEESPLLKSPRCGGAASCDAAGGGLPSPTRCSSADGLAEKRAAVGGEESKLEGPGPLPPWGPPEGVVGCKGRKIIVQVDCGHVFHKECLGGWLIKNKVCPLCRKEFFVKDKQVNGELEV